MWQLTFIWNMVATGLRMKQSVNCMFFLARQWVISALNPANSHQLNTHSWVECLSVRPLNLMQIFKPHNAALHQKLIHARKTPHDFHNLMHIKLQCGRFSRLAAHKQPASQKGSEKWCRKELLHMLMKRTKHQLLGKMKWQLVLKVWESS